MEAGGDSRGDSLGNNYEPIKHSRPVQMENCYCSGVFGKEFAERLEECPKTWCGLRNYHEAVRELEQLNPERYSRHKDLFDTSVHDMSELWTKKRGRNRTGEVVERLLREVLAREGFESLTGSELARIVANLGGLFRPDMVVASKGQVYIVESTTWSNPDKLRADFFKGYVAARNGYRLVAFVAGMERNLADENPGFRKVAALAQTEGFVRGVWGIRSLSDFLSYMKDAR